MYGRLQITRGKDQKKEYCQVAVWRGGVDILSDCPRSQKCGDASIAEYYRNGGLTLTQFGVKMQLLNRTMTAQGTSKADKSMCGFSLSGHMRGVWKNRSTERRCLR